MSVFEEFLFGSSTTDTVVSSNSPSQQHAQAQGEFGASEIHDDDNYGDDLSATSASLDATVDSSNNNSNHYVTSSLGTEYGDLLEGMVVGLLEMQQQPLQLLATNDQDDDSSSYFDGRTIVSSAPSEATIRADPTIGGQRTVCRVPSYAVLSLSTTSSNFLNMEQGNESEISSEDASSFRTTLRPSMRSDNGTCTGNIMDHVSDVSVPSVGSGSDHRPSTALMHPTSIQALVHCNPQNESLWFSHFNDSDWEAFRQRVLMVQRCIFTIPPTNMRTFPLPPKLPALVLQPVHNNDIEDDNDDGHHEMTSSLNASRALQLGIASCFLCPLCQDIIVGAIALDCGCQTNLVCAACWEYRCMQQGWKELHHQKQMAQELDYVIVHTPSSTAREDKERNDKSPICPCCYQDVQEPQSCHAMDVAILQLMIMIHSNHSNSRHFLALWESYAERVEQWREELMRRQLENNNCRTLLVEEQRLALLIEEEETFWKGQEQRQKPQRQQRALEGAMPGFFSMVVAVVASVGMKLLISQSIRAIRNNTRS